MKPALRKSPTYHIRIQHNDSYYLQVIQGLLSGLKDGLSDKDMAAPEQAWLALRHWQAVDCESRNTGLVQAPPLS